MSNPFVGIPKEWVPDPGWKPSEWMRARVAKAAFDVLTGQGDFTVIDGPNGSVFSLPLGGITTDKGSEEDFTCDKCNKVLPTGLWTFALGFPLHPKITLMVTGGLCDTCAAEENAKP